MNSGILARSVGLCALLFSGIGEPARAAEWDHVHLLAPDTAAAAQWYAKTFGGQVTKAGPFDAVLFGENLVKFRQSTPETKPSAGSAIDHICFSVPDLAAKMTELKAAGVKVTGEIKDIPAGGFSYAFVEDPWGTKIELFDDKDLIGFHHVGLRSPDPAATVKWYADNFGGEATTFKGLAPLPGIRYGKMWLLVGKAESVEGSVGHSIDHLGWKFTDLDAAIQNLHETKTEFLPSQAATGPTYVLGPDKVKIEVVKAAAH
jgi:catechol 2,3-dioxygenase-like lactoylglutathione lyase family enzyme